MATTPKTDSVSSLSEKYLVVIFDPGRITVGGFPQMTTREFMYRDPGTNRLKVFTLWPGANFDVPESVWELCKKELGAQVQHLYNLGAITELRPETQAEVQFAHSFKFSAYAPQDAIKLIYQCNISHLYLLQNALRDEAATAEVRKAIASQIDQIQKDANSRGQKI